MVVGELRKRVANTFAVLRGKRPPFMSLSQLDEIMDAYSLRTVAGVDMTPTKALQSAAHLNAVWTVASTIGQIPFLMFKRTGPNRLSRERAPAHPLNRIISRSPNPWMTAFDFRVAVQANLMLSGNAYSQIIRNRAGTVVGLYPWPSGKVRQEKNTRGEPQYVFATVDGPVVLPWRQVLHLRGLSLDGWKGESPVELQADTIATSIAADEHAARFFGQGATPQYAISVDGALDDEQQRRLRDTWQKTYAGGTNAHRAAVLEGGAKIEHLGFSPEQAQLIEARKFGITEAARVHNVPPYKVQDYERATFSNVEQASIDYVTYSAGPWFTCWEQAIWAQLLSAGEQPYYFAKFIPAALVRGDIRTRYAAYGSAIKHKWMTPNEVRALEDMNPIDGGDEFPILQGQAQDKDTDDDTDKDEADREAIPDNIRTIRS